MAGTQDTGFVCAGGVVGAGGGAVYPAGGEPAEGGGFHPLRVELQFGGAVQSGLLRRKQGTQARHQRLIADAAAAHIHLPRSRRAAADGLRNALCAVFKQGTQHVVGVFSAV